MPQPFVLFHGVSYTYETSARPVLTGLNLHFPVGWTGIVGANGSGKTTLLKLATGLLAPETGTVQEAGFAQYCAQRTDEAPTALPAFLEAPDSYRYRALLAIGDDWPERWSTLSHGERKRAQLAVALWRGPQVLAVDEPTNHLDGEARAMLREALAVFAGVGLLVSHDRELLDDLCDRCLFLEEGSALMRPGNYSAGLREASREESERARCYQKARKERNRLEREVKRARQEVARSAARLSKRKIHPKDHDAKSKIDGARLTGKDAIPARLQKRLETRLHRETAAVARHAPRPKPNLGVHLTGRTVGSRLLYFAEAGHLSLGGDNRLDLPALTIAGGDRIGLAGPNGSGKSTLLRHLLAGIHLPAERLIYLPQEVTAEETLHLKRSLGKLPGAALGQLMQLVSRLGSDPKRVLDSEVPSPGETRKLLLALGLLREPQLIFMDESTNHLDLPSIACLETALADVTCALLLVSHDKRFLASLTTRSWQTVRQAPGQFRLRCT